MFKTCPLVVPDYAKMRYIVRAPTWAELEALRERVKACFEYVLCDRAKSLNRTAHIRLELPHLRQHARSKLHFIQGTMKCRITMC